MEALLIRHGKASNSDPDGEVGSDRPLTKEGIRQVRAVAVYLGKIATAEEIRSSPYRRTQETSEIIVEHLDLDIIIDECFKEIDKGDWHGKPVQEVIEMEGEVPEAEKPWFRPPGGENWLDVGQRVGARIEELGQATDTQQLIVSHNHPIRLGIGWLLGTPIVTWGDLSLDTASVTRLVNHDQTWTLDPHLVNYKPYEDTKS